MSFLSPFVLAGLGFLAVPILVHLRRRRTRRAQAFPSLMFLSQVPYRSLKRRRLRDPLLLLLRCLAVSLVIFAFARPNDRTLPGGDETERTEQTVLLLDRSFSMGEGDRWQRALEVAESWLAQAGPLHTLGLIVFDERAEVMVTPRADVETHRALLRTMQPSAFGTRYSVAVRAARRAFLDIKGSPLRRLVLITDLQRRAFDGDDVRLPQGVEVQVENVSGGVVRNLAVTDLEFERSAAGEGRERVVVTARISAFSGGGAAPEGEPPTVPASLWIDGRETGAVEVAMSESDGVARFEALTIDASAPVRGTVRIQGDTLAADNEQHFVLSSTDSLRALVLESATRSRGGRREEPYLRRALETATSPRFLVARKQAGNALAQDLVDTDVVVINDSLAELNNAFLGELTRFVEAGGGVLLALGPGSSDLLERGGLAAPFQFSPDMTYSQMRSGRQIAALEFEHPVFRPFQASRRGDLSSSRLFRYYLLPEAASDQILARLDDGSAVLLERSYGEGRLLVWGSTLDTRWNDVPLQVAFVPWLDASLRYLAQFEPPRPWYLVGQVEEVDLRAGGGDGWLLVDPDDQRTTLASDRAALLTFEGKGFHELRPVERTTAAPTRVFAVNVDVRESDLRTMEADELAASISALAPAVESSTGAEIDEVEQTDRAWWPLLFGALLFLLAESVLAATRKPDRASGALRPTTAGA